MIPKREQVGLLVDLSSTEVRPLICCLSYSINFQSCPLSIGWQVVVLVAVTRTILRLFLKRRELARLSGISVSAAGSETQLFVAKLSELRPIF